MSSSAAIELAVKIIGENGQLRKTLKGSLDEVGSFSARSAAMAKQVGIAFTAVTATAAFTVAGVHGVSIEAANTGRELRRMAASANATVIEIQAAEYATRDLGFEQGKMADILKDTQDKLGDYIATGGGEFADFFENIAPKVGLTTEELQRMSGPDVLIALKKAMDDTNVSAAEQVFYLEALANDASALIPLLSNNGAQYKQLAGDFLALNTAMTDAEISKFQQYARDVDVFKDSFSALAREAVRPFTADLGEAARYFSYLFGKARKNYLEEDIVETHAQLVRLKEEIADLEKNGRGKYYQHELDKVLAFKRKQLLEVETALRDLQEHNDQLNGKPANSTGTPPPVSPNSTGGKSAADELARLQDLGLRRLDVFDQQFSDEREKIKLQHDLRLRDISDLSVSQQELERRGYENIQALRDDYARKSEVRRDEELVKKDQAKQDELLRDYEAVAQEFLTKEQLELAAMQRRQEVLRTSFEQGLLTEETYHAVSLKNEEKYQKKLQALETARMQERLKGFQDLFGGIAGILKVSAGEQSGAYKVMFAASKAFAVAESIIKIQQGIASAASLPFPANIPAIGSVVSLTAGIISTIQGTQLKGQAHNGYDSIPTEGTWNLAGGERIVTKRQNEDLTSFLSGAGAVKSSPSVQVFVQPLADSNSEWQQEQSELDGQTVIRLKEIAISAVREDLHRGGDLDSDLSSIYNMTRAG